MGGIGHKLGKDEKWVEVGKKMDKLVEMKIMK
jgi:hypothetical protein